MLKFNTEDLKGAKVSLKINAKLMNFGEIH